MKARGLLAADFRILIKRLPFLLLGSAVIVLCILIALPSSLFRLNSVDDIKIAVVCDSNNAFMPTFMGIASDYQVVGELRVLDATQAATALRNKEVEAVIEIPDDIINRVIDGDDVTITLSTHDPLIGTVAYSIANSTVQAAKKVQIIFNRFYASASSHISDQSTLWNAEYALGESILQEVILRLKNIEVVRGVSSYKIQVLSIILFLCISILAVFMVLLTSWQISSGYLRRLKIRNVSAYSLMAVKCLIMLLLSVVIAMLLYPLSFVLNSPISYCRWIGTSCIIALGIYSILTAVTLCKGRQGAIASKTLLLSVAFIILMLFAGGGFYPVYVMDHSVRLLNPAWITHVLVQWSLYDTVAPVGSMTAILVISCMLFWITGWRWRRFGC
ncbi:MAG: ABC transporter permease [Lachnospiraceae bacterium]|jgi:hypothetical protein|nr:ABC transporter permease [Lachnospiraceae bacterium]